VVLVFLSVCALIDMLSWVAFLRMKGGQYQYLLMHGTSCLKNYEVFGKVGAQLKVLFEKFGLEEFVNL